MDKKPTHKEIAVAAKITESEVGIYKTESEKRPDGSWRIYFSHLTPTHLRGRLASDLTLVICASRSAH